MDGLIAGRLNPIRPRFGWFYPKGLLREVKGISRMNRFFSDRPFKRDDEKNDALFYTGPRFTEHLDELALEVIRNIYGRLLTDGMCVLDLMSSWRTYIPASLKLEELVGVGMNAEELQKNERLNRFKAHDSNADPVMRLESNWG